MAGIGLAEAGGAGDWAIKAMGRRRAQVLIMGILLKLRTIP
jgi:hypothetical protein